MLDLDAQFDGDYVFYIRHDLNPRSDQVMGIEVDSPKGAICQYVTLTLSYGKMETTIAFPVEFCMEMVIAILFGDQ